MPLCVVFLPQIVFLLMPKFQLRTWLMPVVLFDNCQQLNWVGKYIVYRRFKYDHTFCSGKSVWRVKDVHKGVI